MAMLPALVHYLVLQSSSLFEKCSARHLHYRTRFAVVQSFWCASSLHFCTHKIDRSSRLHACSRRYAMRMVVDNHETEMFPVFYENGIRVRVEGDDLLYETEG